MESIVTTEEEKCIAVVASVLGLMSLFIAIRSHFVHLRVFFAYLCERLRNSYRCVNWIRKQEQKQLGDDTYQQFVKHQMQQKRRIITRTYHWYFLFMLNLSVASLMSNIILGRPRWMNANGGWVALAFELLVLIFLHCPEFSNKLSLNFHYLIIQCVVAWYLSIWGGDSEAVSLRSMLAFAFVSIPAVGIPTQRCAVFLSQGALAGLIAYRSYTEDLAPPCVDISSLQVAERTLVSINSSFIVIATIAFSIFEALMRYQVVSNIREKNSKTQLSAASSLLDLTCDAVVELDQCLRMKSHSMKLSAMLLRTGTSLEGLAFSDLLGPDSERVNQRLQKQGEDKATPSAATTAHVFQTHLVDSSGNRFCIEVFQVKYTLTDGQKCHTLGLRSLEDQEALVRRMVSDSAYSATVAKRFSKSDNSQAKDEISPLSRRLSMSSSSKSSKSSHSSRSSRSHSPEIRSPKPSGSLTFPKAGVEAKKDSFLDIDVVNQLVNAATAPFSFLVGTEISSIFSPYTIALLEKVCGEERRAVEMANSSMELDLPNRVVFFSQMPFYVHQLVLEINGKMKVSRTKMAAYHVIICFTESRAPQSLAGHRSAL